MQKLCKKIAESRKFILVIAIVLLIPSVFGSLKTKINYDLLSYLPEELDTMKAQEILKDNFNTGTISMLIVENMDSKDVVDLKNKIAKVPSVEEAIWIDDLADTTVPQDIYPEEVKNLFYSGENSTMILITMSEGSSAEETQEAIEEIRHLTDKEIFLGGTAGIVKDTKDLADKETPFYVLLAVALSVLVLSLTMTSYVTPIIFLTSIGIAIIYNFGTNVFLGQISYVTKALAAVLQLGVTMDYSIFLLHRYDEERAVTEDRTEAMASAIEKTFASITGSSLTTIAGFMALIVMELTLGKDIGIVMAKGVLLGVLCTLTILPALILTFDRVIHKYNHKQLLPEFKGTAKFVTKHYKAFIAVFIVLFIPAIYGNSHAKVYYNLDRSLPQDLPSIVATNKMKNDYNMTSTNMILVREDLDGYNKKQMIDEIENLDGISSVIALEKVLGPRVPIDFLPQDLMKMVKSDGYERLIINSKYAAASDEVNNQLDDIEKIVKKYDSEGLIGGEAPLTKDLIRIADSDFKKVNVVSIVAIFAIIALVFKSLTIPILLVLAIELAIFINMGIPFYTGTVIPFIASIVIGTIQLGATVDYAILLTSRFKDERNAGLDKFEAVEVAVQSSAKSIVTSALTFFAATAGVGLISKLEMISSLCNLMSRGALISMFVIIFILPSILLVCDGIIEKTSKGFGKNVEERAMKDAI
ncbi:MULTISPECIES: efflux RND transporter permease subunit [Clostridium]|uniref:Antibiotic ABC transporter permease n=1 Tax=Clostridium cadaveris TaxID=1529 RepID=A0A1I2MWX5_9CLOT|nr:MMPL family transporter [Clostridium cadaveris]MDU4951078.1 MMPL family transporter [Clostridium sp.]MDM8313373.1 MMPL family transporter [Clostridium cadaveris]NME65028.1 MMPL family transporter [Clostridium cadaveris]PWL52954.1 MAG: antibiotic ABC transporter permease [Clostridium cadaveris]UFH66243.1 MMPL family transporter [Clostridium cadaveris]